MEKGTSVKNSEKEIKISKMKKDEPPRLPSEKDEVTQAPEVLSSTEKKDLLAKIELWKSVADFNKRSLDREKVKSKKNELTLTKLKLELSLLKKNALKSEKMIKV